MKIHNAHAIAALPRRYRKVIRRDMINNVVGELRKEDQLRADEFRIYTNAFSKRDMDTYI